MAYLLDANVFISAKNLHYGFDFCPAFWDWIIQQHLAGKVFSVEKVRDEILEGGDELADWVEGLPEGFFKKPDAATMPAFATIATWVNDHPDYTPAAKSTFLQVGDYYLIAQALADRQTVVTHETPANSRNIVKIPNVCLGLGVDHMTPFHMLRRERARFVLAPRAGQSAIGASPSR